MRLRTLLPALLTVLVTAAPIARADPDRDTKDAARTLADEGLGRYKEGDFVGALERFEAAEALVKTPPITLHRARSLERLGRYVAARRIYRSIVALELGPGAPPVHLKAKVDAQAELALLADRISHVTIALDRPLPAGARLFVDGEPTSSDGVVASVDVDPGTHRVDASFVDGRRVGATFDVLSGESTTITLKLPPAIAAPPAPPSPVPVEETSPFTTAGVVGMVVGTPVLGVGIGLAIAAAVKRGDLTDSCPNDTCPVGFADEVDALDTLRFTSTGMLVGGATIVAGSLVLLLAGRADRASDGGARVALVVHPAMAGVVGTFP